MVSEHDLPRLPMDWPEAEARPLPVGAEYEYRPGDARLCISWKVDAGADFSPETEALAIATLLEQAQGFTRAFDLANLGRLRLIHQDGQWAPAQPVPTLRPALNGNGTTAPAPLPAPGSTLSPPVPAPEPEPEPDDSIPYIQQLTDPVLVKEVKEGRPPASFEDWQETKERLAAEQEERQRAEQAQANALRAAGRPETSPPPPRPDRTLDEVIEDAEAAGRLLPTRGEQKKPYRPKRLTHGASMDLNDQIVRLLRHTGRPVYATYVARQLNIKYHQAYERLRKLAALGEVQCRQRETHNGLTGYEFSFPEPAS